MIIQPLLASYRVNFFNELFDHYKSVTVYARLQAGEGFGSITDANFTRVHTPLFGRRSLLYFQVGVISSIIKKRPKLIFITADFRAIHFWVVLIVSTFLKIPVFSHGQGLYNKVSPSLLHRFMFKTSVYLSSQYVCYTPSVARSLIDIGIKHRNLMVVDNTIVNKFTVAPIEKLRHGTRILYIGRMRSGSGLPLLFDAVALLSKQGIHVGLDLVGDGIEFNKLKRLATFLNIDVNFYGSIYDDKEISVLSKKSSIGVYPGDAGLSVVHYMSLSLIPVVHSDLPKHMGPEPSYIMAGKNGLLFRRGDSVSLANVLSELLLDKQLMHKIAIESFKTYQELSELSMAKKIINKMDSYLGKGGN